MISRVSPLLGVSWWCTALGRPWTWEWIPYPGVWIATAIPIVLYLWSVVRHPGPIDRRRLVQFMSGVTMFWAASDWPLGTLGAGYLASAHMLQFLFYTLGAAPLMLLGTPDWLARRVTDRMRLQRVTVWLGSSPVTCGVVYNLILSGALAPRLVDVLRRNQLGSFAMDALSLASGLVLWLPLLSPLPEGRVQSTWARMVYLFVTTGVISIIPASFLTFTTTPVYAVYELAPRIGTLTASEDLQMAGVIMKIGTIPVVWTTMGVQWFRWAKQEAPGIR